jgi:hypothetical protein
MVIADLIAQDRFPGAWRPLDDIDAAAQEATVQNDIEARDPRGHPQ